MQKTANHILCVLIIFSLSLASCSGSKENSLTICDNAKIDDLLDKPDELFTTLPAILLFPPFLFINANGGATYVIARDVKASHDNRIIEVTIRDDVRLHDGRMLTAEEVITSLKNMSRDNYMNINELLYGIKVQASGRYTIILNSEFPISDFESILSNLFIFLPASDPLSGSGPFRFGRWLENGLELSANEEYFDGRPQLDKIVYIYEKDEQKRIQRLLTEEADLIVCISSKTAHMLKKDPRFHVKGDPDKYSGVFLNNESPILSNKVVRRAVAMAINKELIIKKAIILGTEKVLSPFPGTSEKRSAVIGYQPKEAARLLEKEGWRAGKRGGIREKNGKRLRISICYNEDEGDFNKVIGIISQHLFEVGIEVKAVPLQYNNFDLHKVPFGSYDAILSLGQFSASSNLLTWHTSYIDNPRGRNYSRYSNPEVDRLLEEMKIASLERRKKIYARIEAILYEDAPAVLLYQSQIYTAVNKRFKGAEDFTGSAQGVYRIKDWSIHPEAN